MPLSSVVSGIAARGLVAALATGALAASLVSQRPETPATLQTLRTAGAAGAISASRGGDAIVRASDMRGGDSVTGDVTMRWSGQTPASVVLAPRGLSGSLASALGVAVDDLTTGRHVYVGSLAEMGAVQLDDFAPGSSHDFRFTVTLAPDAPDSLQGAAAAVRFDWTATADDPPPTPAPTTPAPPPVAPPTDTTPPHIRLVATKLGVRATCDEACTFRASSSRVTGVKHVKKPKLRVKVSGTSATVALAFDRKSLKLLKKSRKAQAIVTVVAVDAAGNRATAAKRIELRP
jgi:hypothetical protein